MREHSDRRWRIHIGGGENGGFLVSWLVADLLEEGGDLSSRDSSMLKVQGHGG